MNEKYGARNEELTEEQQILMKCLTGEGEAQCRECAKLCDNETEENKDFYSLPYCSIACGLCGNGDNGENFCNQECTPDYNVSDSQGGALCYLKHSETDDTRRGQV